MNKRELKAFKRAVLRNTHWIGKYNSKKGQVEIGTSGDFEVHKGIDYVEIRDKVSVYRFNR